MRAVCRSCGILIRWQGGRGSSLADWACPRCGGGLHVPTFRILCLGCGTGLDPAERLCRYCRACQCCGVTALPSQVPPNLWEHDCPYALIGKPKQVRVPHFIPFAMPKAIVEAAR